MKEVWKPIYNYKNRYEVSNKGRIRSIKKLKDGKVLKTIKKPTNASGYKYVQLWKNGEYKMLSVSRLVAKAFIPNKSKRYREVGHIDRDKSNNNVNNLRWATHRQNMKYLRESKI